MTLDLDDARFEWLRRQAYDSRVPAAEPLRAGIALMQDDAELRRLIVESAETFYGQYDWIRPAASAR